MGTMNETVAEVQANKKRRRGRAARIGLMLVAGATACGIVAVGAVAVQRQTVTGPTFSLEAEQPPSCGGTWDPVNGWHDNDCGGGGGTGNDGGSAGSGSTGNDGGSAGSGNGGGTVPAGQVQVLATGADFKFSKSSEPVARDVVEIRNDSQEAVVVKTTIKVAPAANGKVSAQSDALAAATQFSDAFVGDNGVDVKSPSSGHSLKDGWEFSYVVKAGAHVKLKVAASLDPQAVGQLDWTNPPTVHSVAQVDYQPAGL